MNRISKTSGFAGAVALLVGMSLPMSALASDRNQERVQRHGADTYRWMELQKSGHAADGAPRGLPGEVAEKVWTRYVNSFEHPIPEEFQRDRFVQGGSR